MTMFAVATPLFFLTAAVIAAPFSASEAERVLAAQNAFDVLDLPAQLTAEGSVNVAFRLIARRVHPEKMCSAAPSADCTRAFQNLHF